MEGCCGQVMERCCGQVMEGVLWCWRGCCGDGGVLW